MSKPKRADESVIVRFEIEYKGEIIIIDSFKTASCNVDGIGWLWHSMKKSKKIEVKPKRKAVRRAKN